MASSWVKSLQCKSRAVDDVINPHPKQPFLTSTTSCKSTFYNLKDVVHNNSNSNAKPKPRPRSKPIKDSHSVKPRPEPEWVRRAVSAPITKCPVQVDPFFPSVTELHVGHPSRNVVEIIFHTRWGPRGFSGRVEVVFKVHNLAGTLARFEEYRDKIRSRSGSGRCVADGNEMMRFHCLGPSPTNNNSRGGGGGVMDGSDGLREINGCKGATSGVCTYSGSGAAHESAGGGLGRRAMVVCRVIAGRVSKRVDIGPRHGPKPNSKNIAEELGEFDSVSGDNGELLVYDSRAVLPCFLVIYKL